MLDKTAVVYGHGEAAGAHILVPAQSGFKSECLNMFRIMVVRDITQNSGLFNGGVKVSR